MHGRGDDVIPWFEAEKIAAALAAGYPWSIVITGMASRTGSHLPPLAALAYKAALLVATARAIHDALCLGLTRETD